MHSPTTYGAETKYNATTKCTVLPLTLSSSLNHISSPHLFLHSAVANGNIGLVHYALLPGPPINVVLNGISPLHVASSGWNDLAVKVLIEQERIEVYDLIFHFILR